MPATLTGNDAMNNGYAHILVEDWGFVRLPDNWQQHGRKIRTNGLCMTIRGSLAVGAYSITLDGGSYLPSDKVLISLCLKNVLPQPAFVNAKVIRMDRYSAVVLVEVPKLIH